MSFSYNDRYELRLVAKVRVQHRDGALVLRGPRSGLNLQGRLLSLAAAIERLKRGTSLSGLAGELPESSLMPLLGRLLTEMDARGLIERTVMNGGDELVTLTPSAGKRCLPDDEVADRRWRLSRFAYMRREKDDALLECSLSFGRLTLHAPEAVAVVHRLIKPASKGDLAIASGLSASVVDDLLAVFVGAGFVEAHDDPESEATRSWEFHDLLFHWRSRAGRHDLAYGDSHRSTMTPGLLPVLKPPGQGEQIPLLTPSPGSLENTNSNLSALLANRRSIRKYGSSPISVTDLGCFLHLTARHLNTINTAWGELGVRQYPAGGALYELELYLVVNRCEGLVGGLYHYRPGDHALERISPANPTTHALLDQASFAMQNAGRPQVLIVLAARFQRIASKYRAMAYALVLKHVGVLYQSFYLVATYMALAPCAIGGGDSDLFASASGLDPLVEGSVGEFALGSR